MNAPSNKAPAGGVGIIARYKSLALLVFNCAVAVAAINGALWLAFNVRDAMYPFTPNRYGDDILAKAYPEHDLDEVYALIDETWNRPDPLIFESFTVFKERPLAGCYVNVGDAGYRSIGRKQPWPPRPELINVFVFGGSTVFGYGAPDDKTIPAQLDAWLRQHMSWPVEVYNFGRAGYFSTQERILFEQLLLADSVPNVAVFVDGMNDSFYDNGEPSQSKVLAQASEPKSASQHLALAARQTSIGRFAVGLQKRLGAAATEAVEPADKAFQEIIDRYLRNKRAATAVANAFGVVPLFIWQPNPAYKFDEKYHPFVQTAVQTNDDRFIRARRASETMSARLDEVGENFLWLGDIHEDRHEVLYVDGFHYGEKFCGEIAAAIGQQLIERGALHPGAKGE